MLARLLALAAAALLSAGALSGCQALWDLPGQMRPPYDSSGSPLPAAKPDNAETLP